MVFTPITIYSYYVYAILQYYSHSITKKVAMTLRTDVVTALFGSLKQEKTALAPSRGINAIKSLFANNVLWCSSIIVLGPPTIVLLNICSISPIVSQNC